MAEPVPTNSAASAEAKTEKTHVYSREELLSLFRVEDFASPPPNMCTYSEIFSKDVLYPVAFSTTRFPLEVRGTAIGVYGAGPLSAVRWLSWRV